MKVGIAVLCSTLALGAAPLALAQGPQRIGTTLDGYQEAAPAAISTAASGEFHARINREETEIEYELSYSGLEAAVTQAHIHFGRRGTNGGISVFLCTNLSNGPAGTQACPASPATVTGTIVAADVIGPSAQGIDAGQFAELIKAIRDGSTYVNVHSTKFPTGEVRGQLPGHGRGHDHH